MEKTNKYILFLLIIFSFCVSFEESIEFKAQNIMYIDSSNTIILTDNITIQTNNLKITADSVYIDRSNNSIFAFGNINLKHYSMSIKGDSAFYNYNTEKSIIYNGNTKIEKGYFYGNKISSSNENVYSIINGHFTTCEYVNDPHYKISSSRIKYIENDRIELLPAILYLKNVPVFGLPFAIIPAATKRKSGFLMPSFGYSEIDGFYIRELSYFWAINNFSDMTFSIDYYTKRSFLIAHEFRVIIKPYINFLLNSYFINEFSGNKRWSLKGNYSHNLPFDISLKSKWDIMSDINIFTDYNDTSVVSLKRIAETFLSLSKEFKIYSSYISFSRKQDYYYNTIKYSLPQYRGYFNRITLMKNIVFPSGLNFSHSHGINNDIYIDTITKNENRIIYLNNTFNTNYNILKYFLFQPSFSTNYTNYINEYAKLSLNTNILFNTHIYGVSVFELYPYDKFRHTIIPSIKFSINDNRYLKFDSYEIDSSSVHKSIVFSLINNFEGKKGKSKTMLLRLSSSIVYNIQTDSFSLLSVNANVLPNEIFNINTTMNYNIYTKDKNYTINASLTKRIHNPFSNKDLNISINDYIKTDINSIVQHQLTIKGQFYAGKNLNITTTLLYDLLNYSLISSVFSINRDLHCWNASFIISTYGQIFKYDFKISLKEFPEISLDKGILGPLFF